jgi:ribosomal protein L11 methylase PrmA
MLREHWQSVYRSKEDAELSWFEERPETSLDLVRSLPRVPRSAIDIGGGQSAFAGELLQLGVESITVLDLSAAALERGKARLGANAAHIECFNTLAKKLAASAHRMKRNSEDTRHRAETDDANDE